MNTSIPPPNMPPANLNAPPPTSFNSPPDITQQPPPLTSAPPPSAAVVAPPSTNGIDGANPFSQPPPGFYAPPPGMFPDFSRPPPGFPPKPERQLEELMPTAPYYDLPAGLMVPLIKVCLHCGKLVGDFSGLIRLRLNDNDQQIGGIKYGQITFMIF